MDVETRRRREQRLVKEFSSLSPSCLNEMLQEDASALKRRLSAAAKVQAVMDSVTRNFKLTLPFDLAFVIVSDFPLARFSTKSNDIVSLPELDGERDMEILSPSMLCEFDGHISEWHYFAQRHSELYGCVWRRNPESTPSNPRFTLLGYNKLPVTETPAKHTHCVPLEERIAVKRGDWVGHRCDGRSGIPYSWKGESRTRWTSRVPRTEVGKQRDMVVGSHCVYAYGFTLQSVYDDDDIPPKELCDTSD